MQVIYHGHSFIEIERQGTSILIDPFISNNPRCDISLDIIVHKDITNMLLTHLREDMIEDIMTIVTQTGCTLVVLADMCQWLQSQGVVGEIVPQDLGAIYMSDDWSVQFVESHHHPNTENGGLSSGLVFDFSGIRVYHAGNTTAYSDMDTIQNINLALLPIGGTYMMGVDDAVQACGMMKPKIVVPIHYNTNSTLKADDLYFAQQIMLKQYAVPKVLRAGQYIVL